MSFFRRKLTKKGQITIVEFAVENSPIKNVKVRKTEKTYEILYLKETKNHEHIYDCFDDKEHKMPDVFKCEICNDIFSKTGGNKNRHILHHLKLETTAPLSQMAAKIRFFMYKNALPFSLIEDDNFRNLFTMKLPCVETFLKHMINDYEILLKEFQKHLNVTEHISITLGEWTFYNV
ncbi:hypothetical protein TRFO_14409 [Tritrichomonas foetus]|uniref:BED-type domain-containing protein n=1 Tax=Tritrichomonas foetus TaxID=1144522 RepID=A0A1J4KZD2_9EUKA|nr:hypothetical protein TRFO_14409 [Tritrichomonas foetus]|eukprot:OHT15070.1 hypothetical protein TRFO_14409 [Tritrichomonas foetus]